MATPKKKATKVPTSRKPTKESPPAPVKHGRASWDPIAEMEDLFRQMIGRPFSREWMSPLRMGWPHREFENMPRVDVIDRDHEVVVRAEVPGVDRKDLEISLSGNAVTFRGQSKSETEQEKGEYRYRETTRGEFLRTVPLPADVDDSAAKASYKDGIVELTLPKVEAAKRRRIEIVSD